MTQFQFQSPRKRLFLDGTFYNAVPDDGRKQGPCQGQHLGDVDTCSMAPRGRCLYFDGSVEVILIECMHLAPF